MTTLMRRPAAGTALTDDFDRLFGSLFGVYPERYGGSPAVDIRENKDGYVLEADLPGMEEKDLDIKIEDNLLVISAEKKESAEKNEEDRYILRERRSFSFKRSFVLPKDADAKKVEASFKDGQLVLEIKKREEAKPVTIKVNGK